MDINALKGTVSHNRFNLFGQSHVAASHVEQARMGDVVNGLDMLDQLGKFSGEDIDTVAVRDPFVGFYQGVVKSGFIVLGNW